MENKINIAEILKDCPKGMELYSPLCGECKLYDVNDYTIRIETPNKDTLISLYHDGRYCSNGEIMLFPKGKTTWEGFAPLYKFKEGDIAISDKGDIHLLRTEDSSYCAYRKYAWRSTYEFDSTITTSVKVVRLATEEEKAKLFQAIKENGYKWNKETKTLDKLVEPIFKVGNKIRRKNVDYTYIVTIAQFDDNYYDYVNEDGQCGVIPISKQNKWELVPDKFDVINFKPFMKVLVRDNNNEVWFANLFSNLVKNSDKPFVCIGWSALNEYTQCIPFVGNEHLRGTTQDCDEYYKNW